MASSLPPDDKVKLLTTDRGVRLYGLSMAAQKGQKAVVSTFVKQVLASDLSWDEKVQLLAAETGSGLSALHIALQKGHDEVVKTLVAQVLASELPLESKIALLTAKGMMAYPDCVWLFKADMQMHWKRLRSRYWHQACHLIKKYNCFLPR